MPPDNKKSELEKLQTNSQLMTLVVESASDAIIIFNKKGDICHRGSWNFPSFESSFCHLNQRKILMN